MAVLPAARSEGACHSGALLLHTDLCRWLAAVRIPRWLKYSVLILRRHGYCAYVPIGQDIECFCVLSDMWCCPLFEKVLRECVRAFIAATTLEQKDILLRSFAEAITRAVFPKPGEVLRLPVGAADLVFEHPTAHVQRGLELVVRPTGCAVAYAWP